MKLLVIGYLLSINLAAFVLYGIDKRKAVRRRYRIPESVLMGLAVLGGSPGAWAGMRLFRHKTKKPKFRFGVPLIFAVQLLLFILAVF